MEHKKLDANSDKDSGFSGQVIRLCLSFYQRRVDFAIARSKFPSNFG